MTQPWRLEAGAGGLIMIMQASHYSGGVEVRPGCGGHLSMIVQFIHMIIFLIYLHHMERDVMMKHGTWYWQKKNCRCMFLRTDEKRYSNYLFLTVILEME